MSVEHHESASRCAHGDESVGDPVAVPALSGAIGDTHELADRLAEAAVRLEADDRPTIKAASNFLRAAIQLLQDT